MMKTPRNTQKSCQTIKWIWQSCKVRGWYEQSNCIFINCQRTEKLNKNTTYESIQQEINYSQLNLTKYIQDLCTIRYGWNWRPVEIYTILRYAYIVKISILFILMCRFNVIPVSFLVFCRNKVTLSLIWKCKYKGWSKTMVNV